MPSLYVYPSLKRLVDLLSMEVFPEPRKADDEHVNPDYGEELIGVLTSGEAHLYLAMLEAENAANEAKEGVSNEGDLTPEIIKKVFDANFLSTSFWRLTHERLASTLNGTTPTSLGIRRDFQIVRCFEDCGCHKGLRCAVVMAGLIDSKSGKETMPESGEAAVEAFTFIRTEGSEECIAWCDETLADLVEHLGFSDTDESDSADDNDTGVLGAN